MSDLTKPSPPSEASFALSKGKLTSKSSGFKQRLNAVKSQSESTDPNTMPNRICLMLDCSGSMDTYEGAYVDKTSKRRIDLLKDSVQNFVSRCSFTDTSVAIATFPGRSDKALPLTSSSAMIHGYIMGLKPSGNTPLHDCVVRSLTDIAMTRGVIVSDGGATDWPEDDTYVDASPDAVLALYKTEQIPLDCVHISSGTDGETLLRRIAAETGGLFLKFSDVNAFSKAFGYLSPGYRAMLTNGSISARELGAKEINK